MAIADISPLSEVDQARPGEQDERFHSVTTILGALDKPALLYWAAEQAAIAACDNCAVLPQRMELEGRDAIVKWLRDARFRPAKGKRSATELGQAVHDACEQYALTGERPTVDEEVAPYLEQFDRWAQRFSPQYEAAEAAVYNRAYGYAGTLDAIATVAGMRLIVDYKSSARSVDLDGKPTTPYPEAALQLAAYRHAEIMATWRARRYEKWRKRYYLLNEAEREMAAPMPQVEGGVVIHITPQRCEAFPIKCDDEVFESFLHLMENYRWQQGLSREVVGAPIEAQTA